MGSTVSKKVWASTLAAAIVTLAAWGANLAGVTLPPEVQGALTVIVVFIAGYLKIDPERSA